MRSGKAGHTGNQAGDPSCESSEDGTQISSRMGRGASRETQESLPTELPPFHQPSDISESLRFLPDCGHSSRGTGSTDNCARGAFARNKAGAGVFMA